MFRLRISLKWFLVGTVAAAILIAIGKRHYDGWQQRRWLAAPVVAGGQQEFDEWQYRRWLDKQKSIRDALAAGGARFFNREDYLVLVEVDASTDRRCLSALAEATALEEFGARVPLADVDFVWLKNHPGLKRLPSITGRGVTNHTLAAIGTCQKLEYVSIESSSITDEGPVHLAGLHRLEHLALNHNPVTGRGFGPLARLPRLSVLRLAGCPVNDEGLVAIGKLQHLESLNLAATKIDGSGLAHLAALPKLRTLWLNHTPIVDGDGFAELDAVESLELAGQAKLRPGTLKNVAKMKSLEHLFLGNSKVTDDLLPELSGAQHLRELNLNQTPISDAGLIHLDSLTGLCELWLQQTSVSEAGARRLSQALPRTKINYTGGSIGPSQ
jgi:Leucine-rich repeat (LRR) protein